jgi:hypothetical protein
MRAFISCGSERYEILLGVDDQPLGRILAFHHRTSAVLFLKRFRRDYFSVRNMRQAVAGGICRHPTSRLDDHAVIEALAGDLVAGRLRIAELEAGATLRVPTGGGDSGGTAGPAAEPQAAAVPPIAAPLPPPTSPEPQPSEESPEPDDWTLVEFDFEPQDDWDDEPAQPGAPTAPTDWTIDEILVDAEE